MPRIRTIKPDFWDDRRLARDLSRDQRLFYVGLWNQADDDGRFKADPRRLLGAIFPYEDDLSPDFADDTLKLLAATGRLVVYDVDGEPYGQLTKFSTHQKINRPTPSKIPSPATTPTPSPTPHGGLTESSLPEVEVEKGNGKGKEDDVARDDEQQTARLSMVQQVDEYAATLAVPERKRFLALATGIVDGSDYAVWQDRTGTQVGWSERPRLIKLALANMQANPGVGLRSSLRYVAAQQLDPFPVRSSLADTEARAVKEELPQSRDGKRGSDLQRVNGDDLAKKRIEKMVEEWMEANPDRTAEFEREAIEEFSKNGLLGPSTRAATVRGRVIEKIRKEISRVA